MYGISLAILFSLMLQSDGAVHGRIVAADGSGLPRAAVVLTSVATGEKVQIAADDDGRFMFAGVRAGQYVVSASSEGFRTGEVRLALEPREVRAVTLSLDVAGLEVSVKVTADASVLPSTHSPSSTVLTGERLDSLPVFQRTNLPDAVVTSAPGMIRGHDDFVHIRGHEIALNPLIDGVSFWENTHAAFSSGLSPEVIETANVMTGGFPAEYGNRFGGIVDIVTKSGFRMEHRGGVTLSAGGAGRRRAAGELGGARGRLGYYVFGSAFGSERFFSPPDPVAFHDAAAGGHLFAAFDGRSDRHGTFRAVIMADGTDAQIPKSARDVELRPQASAEQRARQQTAIVEWTRPWSTTLVDASVYQRWSRLELSPATGPLTAAAQLTRELRTFGAKADVTRLAGRHALKVGVDAVRLRPQETLAYDYQGYRDLTHLLGLPHIHVAGQSIRFAGRDSGGQVSAFLQDRIELGSRLTTDVGVRVDRYSLVVSDTHASPRVNVAMRAGGGVVVHASYNHFFVPPPIEGVLSSSAGLTRSINEIGVALPPLGPTVEDQVEAGVSAPLALFHASLTGYYRATDNPVHTTVWPDSRIYSYASFDRARAYGLEARVEVPGLMRYGVTGSVNYALGRVHFFNPVTGGFVTEAAHLAETNRFLAPMDQTHTFTGTITFGHRRSGASVGAAVEYGSGTPVGHGDGTHEHAAGEGEHGHATDASAAPRVPGHLTGGFWFGFDVLRGAGRRPALGIRLDVENVANETYVIARESEFSPSQYSTPRVVSLTARIRF